MKLLFEKKVSITIDTDVERKRIAKAFKNNKETRDKLNQLMDLIEAGKWKDAEKELDGDWWQGYDERLECPRLEFVGMIKHDSLHLNRWFNYMDLILLVAEYPEVYKVTRQKD